MIQKLFAALSGRTTAFCAGFFLAGNVMHLVHRLDGTYIAFMGTLLGFVVGHSIKEDVFAGRQQQPGQEQNGQP